MIIKDVIFAPGKSSFFFDDQRAIKQGARHDGFIYIGDTVTPGFRQIRKSGECISVILMLEDGQAAVGDCTAVQYSGAGGRDPLFLTETYIPFLEKHIRPLLTGMKISSFRAMAGIFETMEVDGKRLHTAIRYGLSQALLEARSKEQMKLQCEVLCDEFNLPVIPERIPIFGQSGDDRYINVDKMILKEADVLPHGLINNVEEKLGRHGEKLKEYIEWLVDRIEKLRIKDSYRPSIHIDIYGTIGEIFDYDMEKVAHFCATLETCARGYPLYLESPVDMEEKDLEIESLLKIRERLASLGSSVKIVADEWCNTLEDIRDFADAGACHMVQIKTPDLGGIQNIMESIAWCKSRGIESYQGGSCNETDVSARACVQVAMAGRPERMLAKPGMGFDEGYTIVNNEMERTMGILKYRHGKDQ